MLSRKYSIRKHIAWLTLTPLLVMVITMESFFLSDRTDSLSQDLITRGRLIGSQLAASSEYGVFSNNHTFLNNIAESAMQQADVRAVIILDDTHIMAAVGSMPQVLAATSQMASRKVSYKDTWPEKLSPKPLLALINKDAPLLDQGETVLLYQPIMSTQIALSDIETTETARQLGAVIIEMSWKNTRLMQSRMLWLTITATFVFLLLTLYIIYLASRRIIEPISQLNMAIQAIGAGNLDTRVSVPSCINELCNLSNGINQMTADLQYERSLLQLRIDEATIQLRTLAFYDTLTQLPNRRLLNDRLAHALATSKRSGKYGALMFLDLDNFKPVNDQYGHAAGDLLLIEAAQRISSCLREMDTVARFGGDEFVVMLGELDTKVEESVRLAYLVAEKIRNSLGQTYHLTIQQEGQPERTITHRCSSSIGVTMFLDHHANQDEIMTSADTAMYQAKQSGRDRINFYNAEAKRVLATDDQP
ncbi:MAG: diguanylate cyclase [Gallionella sp.]